MIRLANWADIGQLARIHCLCSSIQPGGFMHHLGVCFFRQYYRILLKEPTCVIIVAEDEHDGIVGIASGTLDASKESDALYAGRFRLLAASMSVLLRRPWLAKAVYHRVKQLSASNRKTDDPIDHGPRFSFWGHLSSHPSKTTAIRLHRCLLGIMEDLGADFVRFETDVINSDVTRFNEMLGAEIIKVTQMIDGRVRAIGIHRLDPKSRSRIKAHRRSP